MSDNIIHLEEEMLKNKFKTYKEHLHKNYVIVKRKEQKQAAFEIEIKMQQYDLFHLQTHESYMVVSIFPDLKLLSVRYANSEVICTLHFEMNITARKQKNITVHDIENMISYIQFTQTELYSNTLEDWPELAFIKKSEYYEKYQQILIEIEYFLNSVAKLDC